MFSEKATKIDEIFIDDLSLTTYCQIDGEDFVKFCGLLRKHKHKSLAPTTPSRCVVFGIFICLIYYPYNRIPITLPNSNIFIIVNATSDLYFMVLNNVYCQDTMHSSVF